MRSRSPHSAVASLLLVLVAIASSGPSAHAQTPADASASADTVVDPARPHTVIIYKHVRPSGAVMYSQFPEPGAERLEVRVVPGVTREEGATDAGKDGARSSATDAEGRSTQPGEGDRDVSAKPVRAGGPPGVSEPYVEESGTDRRYSDYYDDEQERRALREIEARRLEKEARRRSQRARERRKKPQQHYISPGQPPPSKATHRREPEPRARGHDRSPRFDAREPQRPERQSMGAGSARDRTTRDHDRRPSGGMRFGDPPEQ